MNKNYPIYKTTFIDDMRSLVEEAAQNFPESIAIFIRKTIGTRRSVNNIQPVA